MTDAVDRTFLGLVVLMLVSGIFLFTELLVATAITIILSYLIGSIIDKTVERRRQ